MPELVVGSPEWVAEHRTGLGGTDMSRILGLSRFGGPFDVFLEKRGLTAPLIETEAMEWGKLLEDPVARKYARKVGRRVSRAPGFLRHPTMPFMFANVDRWSDKKGTARRVLEVKTSSVWTADDFGEEYTDEVPDDYLAQVQHYMFVTDRERADLAVLIGGQRHRVYDIPRDDELIGLMVEQGEKFWRDTEQGIPPAMDGSDGAAEYLKTTYKDRGTEHPMEPGLASLGFAYAGLKAEAKELEAKTKVIGNQIRDWLGEDQWAEGEGVRITYASRKGATRVDWPSIAQAAKIKPALIQEFTRQDEPTRALTVTIKSA